MKIQFLSASAGGGADTNTNIANSNLSVSEQTRNFTMIEGGTFAIQSSEDQNLFSVVNDSAAITIGNDSSWVLPQTRAGAQYDLPFATNALGGVSWETANIDTGAAFLIMSGTVGTFNGTNYLFFKKNGGAGLENSSITIGAANLANLEMAVWDGKRQPLAFRFVGIRDAGVADGCSLSLFHGTPNASGTDIAFTEGADLATGLLSTNTANFQTASGTIAASDYSGMAAGDFYMFGLQNINQNMTTMKVWITIYFADTIKY